MWVRPEEHRVAAGEALAAARSRAGITPQELARRLGKPQSFVSAYENGQRRIDLLQFLEIVAKLDADPDAVFREVVRRRAATETTAG